MTEMLLATLAENSGWVWTVAVLIGSTLLAVVLMPRGAHHTAPLEALQKRIGLEALNPGLFFLVLLIWAALVLFLISGLIWVLADVVTTERPANDDAWRDWRLALTKVAAVTAVLGAVVAFPFTLVRIGLIRAQNLTAELSLFNEKVRAASEDLYATKLISRPSQALGERPVWRDMHEDDIVRRNVAVLTLETLANERPETVPEIAQTLSAYVREMSKEHPPEAVPNALEGDALNDWASGLEVKRPDMQTAVQVLGRLRKRHPKAFEAVPIDLRATNLQAMQLNAEDLLLRDFDLTKAHLNGTYFGGGTFSNSGQLVGCDLRYASLSGSSIGDANLNQVNLSDAIAKGIRFRGTSLKETSFRGAQLTNAQFYGANLNEAILSDAKLQISWFRWTSMLGVDLSGTQLQGAYFFKVAFDKGTDFAVESIRGAAFASVDLTDLEIIEDHLGSVFGDISTTLPEQIPRPNHWSDRRLNLLDFRKAWRKWQAEIGFDPDDPETWDKPTD